MSTAPLFWLGCIVARISLVFLAIYLPALAAPLALAMGLGILSIYTFNLRPDAFEAKGRAWWDGLRPYHGALLMAGGALAARRSPASPYVLGADVVLGGVAWLVYRTRPQKENRA